MKNKIFASLLALTLALSLTACGSKSDDSAKADTTDDAQTEQPAEPQEAVTLNVAASPTPHAEILKQCVPILAEQGIDLQIHEYSDYVVPNTAVEDGDEDANYFQHVPYQHHPRHSSGERHRRPHRAHGHLRRQVRLSGQPA